MSIRKQLEELDVPFLFVMKCSYLDAEEYFDYNIQEAYVGEYTPAFATLMRRKKA